MRPTASIELVDERGNIEDKLTMVGPGASVSIIADAVHRVRLTAERSEADLVCLSLHGHGHVLIEIKQYGVVSADHRSLGEEWLKVAPETALELALLKHLVRIRTYLVVVSRGDEDELLSAVIRPRVESLEQASASLRGWAEASIDRGLEQVQAQLERLRRAGAIGADNRRIVDLPRDMQPDSRTDL
jgi:hypothetical protein